MMGRASGVNSRFLDRPGLLLKEAEVVGAAALELVWVPVFPLLPCRFAKGCGAWDWLVWPAGWQSGLVFLIPRRLPTWEGRPSAAEATVRMSPTW